MDSMGSVPWKFSEQVKFRFSPEERDAVHLKDLFAEEVPRLKCLKIAWCQFNVYTYIIYM